MSIVDHGQTIGKFCDKTNETVLNTTGNKASINFMSNGDGIQAKSFKIDYKLGKKVQLLNYTLELLYENESSFGLNISLRIEIYFYKGFERFITFSIF